MYPELIKSIVDNMNLSNREELIAKLDQANQPNPEAQQAQQQVQAQQAEFQASQTNALNGQAKESEARAAKAMAEAQAVPQELEIDRIKAVTANLSAGDTDDKEFEKRLKISSQLLKEREIAAKEQGNLTGGVKPKPQTPPAPRPEPQPPMMQPNTGQLPQ
tara:strand:- start:159 stop:641 length:483 start_codon:yes stop_codon:yes gene_type:complete